MAYTFKQLILMKPAVLVAAKACHQFRGITADKNRTLAAKQVGTMLRPPTSAASRQRGGVGIGGVTAD